MCWKVLAPSNWDIVQCGLCKGWCLEACTELVKESWALFVTSVSEPSCRQSLCFLHHESTVVCFVIALLFTPYCDSLVQCSIIFSDFIRMSLTKTSITANVDTLTILVLSQTIHCLAICICMIAHLNRRILCLPSFLTVWKLANFYISMLV